MQIQQQHHVAAGSYYVCHSQPLILQSFLGTCVGVALFDEEAQVGGLIHLLLPPFSPFPLRLGECERRSFIT